MDSDDRVKQSRDHDVEFTRSTLFLLRFLAVLAGAMIGLILFYGAAIWLLSW